MPLTIPWAYFGRHVKHYRKQTVRSRPERTILQWRIMARVSQPPSATWAMEHQSVDVNMETVLDTRNLEEGESYH
jgi:hypothetical protein